MATESAQGVNSQSRKIYWLVNAEDSNGIGYDADKSDNVTLPQRKFEAEKEC